jgi:hypothetical protein
MMGGDPALAKLPKQGNLTEHWVSSRSDAGKIIRVIAPDSDAIEKCYPNFEVVDADLSENSWLKPRTIKPPFFDLDNVPQYFSK